MSAGWNRSRERGMGIEKVKDSLQQQCSVGTKEKRGKKEREEDVLFFGTLLSHKVHPLLQIITSSALSATGEWNSSFCSCVLLRRRA